MVLQASGADCSLVAHMTLHCSKASLDWSCRTASASLTGDGATLSFVLLPTTLSGTGCEVLSNGELLCLSCLVSVLQDLFADLGGDFVVVIRIKLRLDSIY